MTEQRILTAAERVHGYRGNWKVITYTGGNVTEHKFTHKRAALGFAASMARIDRTVARRRRARLAAKS